MGFRCSAWPETRRSTEDGVSFRAHTDGSLHHLTPERAVDLQLAFRSDIMMPLDHLVGLPAETPAVRAAMDRTHRWLNRAVAHHADRDGASHGSALFGICQGGIDPILRRESAAFVGSTSVAGWCDRGSLGRREQGGDGRDDRGRRSGAAHRPPPVSDGSRLAGGSLERRRAGCRPVRLRPSDAAGTQCRAVYPGRAPQSAFGQIPT